MIDLILPQFYADKSLQPRGTHIEERIFHCFPARQKFRTEWKLPRTYQKNWPGGNHAGQRYFKYRTSLFTGSRFLSGYIGQPTVDVPVYFIKSGQKKTIF